MKNGNIAHLIIDVQQGYMERRSVCALFKRYAKGDGAPSILQRKIAFDDSLQKIATEIDGFSDACRDRDIHNIFVFHDIDESDLGSNENKPCIQGDFNPAAIMKPHRINPTVKDSVIVKKEYDAFKGTKLEVILRQKDIDTLIISGCTLAWTGHDFIGCIKETVQTAKKLGLNVVLTDDLIAMSEINFDGAETAEQMATRFGYSVGAESLNGNEILERIDLAPQGEHDQSTFQQSATLSTLISSSFRRFVFGPARVS